jgi:endonuclease G, mitochondrial
MTLFRAILLFVLVCFTFSCKENKDEFYISISLDSSENSISKPKNLQKFIFYPSSTTNSVYHRKGFSFSYSESHEQSEWVAYELLEKDMITTNYKRPHFNQDPKVTTASADWRNFKNSGYDRGHLCPAGDRKSSKELYDETFFTSNISPQIPSFNNGVWNRLEQKTRYWATKYNGLYVITGGVLKGELKTIGKEKVAVPNYFYKILMTKDHSKMIGFLVPHEPSKAPLYSFVVTVDEIEKLTGIDFFPDLEDTIENKLEAEVSYKKWSF